jgi:hypothetical protein
MSILKRIFSRGSTPPREGDWRIGHKGRDSMYYEEYSDGGWRRIEISGEMLCGRAHHVIYFSSVRFPDWAVDRDGQIIARIKSKFCPPDYEYYGKSHSLNARAFTFALVELFIFD